MSLSIQDIEKVARLCRLSLSPERLHAMQKELTGILTWINQLQTVDTDNIPPFSHGNRLMEERDDIKTEKENRERLLANAPEADHGMFAVPKVVE